MAAFTQLFRCVLEGGDGTFAVGVAEFGDVIGVGIAAEVTGAATSSGIGTPGLGLERGARVANLTGSLVVRSQTRRTGNMTRQAPSRGRVQVRPVRTESDTAALLCADHIAVGRTAETSFFVVAFSTGGAALVTSDDANTIVRGLHFHRTLGHAASHRIGPREQERVAAGTGRAFGSVVRHRAAQTRWTAALAAVAGGDVEFAGLAGALARGVRIAAIHALETGALHADGAHGIIAGLAFAGDITAREVLSGTVRIAGAAVVGSLCRQCLCEAVFRVGVTDRT